MPSIGLSKPAPHPTMEAVPVGSSAVEGPVLDALGARAGLIAFLRHPGCPNAERTVRRLNRLSVPVVVVLHGEPEHARAWLDAVDASDALRFVFDPDREEYARWGLGLTNAWHFLGPAPLLSLIPGLTEGARNRGATGTRFQRAGTFAVDEVGVVRWRHMAAHGGDLPDLAAGLSALLARG